MGSGIDLSSHRHGPGLFPPVGEVEDEMFDTAAAGRSDASRLSCQLTMPDQDIAVRIPPSQT